MALGGRKIENFDVISLAAWSRGLPICVWWTIFQKGSTGWPQQPQTERASYQQKKMEFLLSIPQKGPVLVIWVPGMIKTCPNVQTLFRHPCLEKYWSFYPSEPFSFDHFTLIHPVHMRYSKMFAVRTGFYFFNWYGSLIDNVWDLKVR